MVRGVPQTAAEVSGHESTVDVLGSIRFMQSDMEDIPKFATILDGRWDGSTEILAIKASVEELTFHLNSPAQPARLKVVRFGRIKSVVEHRLHHGKLFIFSRILGVQTG